MFWGLIMEPGRCYSQTVKVSFHISMAAIDISNSTDEQVQVMCVSEGRTYLLCTLSQKQKDLQCPLDLNFEAGSTIAFAVNGGSHVHLTGYLTEFESDEYQEEEEEAEEVLENKKTRPKRKAADGPPTKKAKQDSEEQYEEESSDSDFNMEDFLKHQQEVSDEEEENDSDEEGEEVEEEEGAEDEDEDEQEDGEDSDESDEGEEEVFVSPTKPLQNGVGNGVAKLQKDKSQVGKLAKSNKQPEKKQPAPQTLKGGVQIQDLKVGTGDLIKSGKLVQVYYEGRLRDTNKMFDSSTKGPGFKFRVGKGEVIKGWDIGVLGMRVGGKRRIVCPPGVAYGNKGSPPVIPPNSTLVFEVEVKKVN